MLKKAITYTDFEGVERTENFYFNLMQAELAEMELTTPGGFATHLQRIAESNDGKQIISTFKEILFKAYGQKSDDGRRFIKSPELSRDFEQTEAYSVLFMELVTNAEAGAAFVNGLMPAQLQQPSDQPLATDIQNRIAAAKAQAQAPTPTVIPSAQPIQPTPPAQPTYPIQEKPLAPRDNPYANGQLEIPDFPQGY